MSGDNAKKLSIIAPGYNVLSRQKNNNSSRCIHAFIMERPSISYRRYLRVWEVIIGRFFLLSRPFIFIVHFQITSYIVHKMSKNQRANINVSSMVKSHPVWFSSKHVIGLLDMFTGLTQFRLFGYVFTFFAVFSLVTKQVAIYTL